MRPDYMLTLSLPRSAWATSANLAELQMRCRWFIRYMQRHRLIRRYCWVREEGAPNPICVCSKEPPHVVERYEAARYRRDEWGETSVVESRWIGQPSPPQGCTCSAHGGSQLHRHFLLSLGTHANREGRRWLPYERLQAAARRCGLGTLDFRPIVERQGAARYVAKYLAKAVGPQPSALGRARRYAFNYSDAAPAAPSPWVFWPWPAELVACMVPKPDYIPSDDSPLVLSVDST